MSKSPPWSSLPLVMAMFRQMLEADRRRAGWSMGQVAWRLGVSVREYRELEAGTGSPNWETIFFSET